MKKDNPEHKAFWRKAVREASRKVGTLGDKALNQNLGFACDSMADAFRIGVEEAQDEIVSRLRRLQNKLAGDADKASNQFSAEQP